jgi:hypothetical protein
VKSYPSIPYHDRHTLNQPCHAFYKYDGSNLRFEWSKKAGWYKFGTRTRLFDHTDPDFGGAIDLFLNGLGDGVEKVFRDRYKQSDRAIVFAEFFGPSSFSGQHVKEEPKDLVLFDVNLHKKGILGPAEFVKEFGHLRSAEVVYQGPFSEEFISEVWEDKLPLVEGVIAKGGEGHSLWMRKVKTKSYKEKLITFFKGDWEKYW